jgi:uncharacterized protein
MKKLLIALALLVVWPAFALDRTDVKILRADGKTITFKVELAGDAPGRIKGLMFRKELPESEGMLFIYDRPGRIAFWMKNTLIPLDMLFFAAKGELVHIYPNATPGSLEPISPDRADICAVLEIAGGQAALKGLKPGDQLLLMNSSACLP